MPDANSLHEDIFLTDQTLSWCALCKYLWGQIRNIKYYAKAIMRNATGTRANLGFAKTIRRGILQLCYLY